MRRPWFGYRHGPTRARVVGETLVRRILRQVQRGRLVGIARLQTTESSQHYTRYRKLIRGMKPKLPNQIWVADITYIRMGTRFFYLEVLLDAFSRAVRGWALSQDLTLDALKMALTKGSPLIFHSDQGSQYSAWLHTDMLDAAGVRISMSDPATPTQNGIAQRFMPTLKDQHVDYADYADFPDAHQQIAHLLQIDYNSLRIHSSLNYATPAEFVLAASVSI